MNTRVDPIVSVVIPAYRHATFVRRAVRSALDQRLPGGCEVIVVNDGSPDDTAAVLRDLAEAGTIRYIEQANAGQAAARNRGLAMAQGRYVAFLDDDDEWPPGRLASHVARLEADEAAVGCYGPYLLIDERGEPLPDDLPSDYPDGDVKRAFRERCWMISPGQATFRRAEVQKIGGFDVSLWGSDDWDLYIRLADVGPIRFDPQPALRYRWHGGNASTRAIEHARNHLKVVRRHLWPDLTLVGRHQRSAGLYFLPKLEAVVDAERRAGRFTQARRACLWQLAFAPGRLLGRQWWASLLRSLARRRIDA